MYAVACATYNVYAQEGFWQEGAKRPHGGQKTNTLCRQSLSGEYTEEREGKGRERTEQDRQTHAYLFITAGKSGNGLSLSLKKRPFVRTEQRSRPIGPWAGQGTT